MHCVKQALSAPSDPVGLAGITDVFRALLWPLNFLPYTGLEVASIGFHMTDNSNDKQGPRVDDNDFIRAYKAYNVYKQQQPTAMVVINARMVNSTQENQRNKTVQLQLPTMLSEDSLSAILDCRGRRFY
ncbi:hypothetical protein F5Y05DRAFT_416384 [Hypoxylon sp. FL0543]|nr:hypothetical protein F5Y05DRAFT_416384 [Hypoxylon sp. FL0543]